MQVKIIQGQDHLRSRSFKVKIIQCQDNIEGKMICR